MPTCNSIALIFFSRSATAEAKNKLWLRGEGIRKNQLLAKALINQTKQVIERSGLDVFHFDETNQAGKTFGEKLANAYASVFGRGYAAAICVGNDTPQLNMVNWQEVIFALANGQNVIGPNCRKGAYLIGITKDSFDKEQFQFLSWQTASLQSELIEYCKTPILLDQYYDLNNWKDILSVAEMIGSFRRFIHSIIGAVWVLIEEFTSIFVHIRGIKNLRAPPSF
jgi:uncharacterized protein